MIPHHWFESLEKCLTKEAGDWLKQFLVPSLIAYTKKCVGLASEIPEVMALGEWG
jgi:hypothetical protein